MTSVHEGNPKESMHLCKKWLQCKYTIFLKNSFCEMPGVCTASKEWWDLKVRGMGHVGPLG